jgi:hypothetical protein
VPQDRRLVDEHLCSDSHRALQAARLHPRHARGGIRARLASDHDFQVLIVRFQAARVGTYDAGAALLRPPVAHRESSHDLHVVGSTPR